VIEEESDAMKKYIIELSAEERHELQRLLRSGKTAARKATRARILLKADDGLSDEQIAEEVSTSVPTIERVNRPGIPGDSFR